MFVYFGPSACLIAGLIIYVTSILFCFDPLYIVLGDVFPDFSKESFTCLLIRMFFTFSAFETARTSSFLFTWFVVYLDMLIHLVENANNIVSGRFPNVYLCLVRSIKLALIYRIMAAPADIGLSIF